MIQKSLADLQMNGVQFALLLHLQSASGFDLEFERKNETLHTCLQLKCINMTFMFYVRSTIPCGASEEARFPDFWLGLLLPVSVGSTFISRLRLFPLSSNLVFVTPVFQ